MSSISATYIRHGRVFPKSERHAEYDRVRRERAIARFLTLYEPELNTGCWLWAGPLFKNGYGKVALRPRQLLAHRWHYEQHKGPIQPGLFVCHRCDTPACVNPAHLFLGTHAENMDDCKSKGRRAAPTAKLTEADVLAIRHSDATNQELAKRYGLKAESLRQVRDGSIWRHVGGPIGTQGRRTVLQASAVLEIRQLYREGSRRADLARQFGVSEAAISRVVKRETWAHIP